MFLSVRQYANSKDLSVNYVRKLINTGKLTAKKVNGAFQIEVPDDQPVKLTERDKRIQEQDQAYTLAMTSKTEIQNELKKQRLLNLRQDTKLKELKNQQIIQKMRREFAEGVFESFTDSFSDLKNFFIELKLNKQQNEKLKNIFKKNVQKFKKKLSDYLEDKDKEQEKTDEVN